MLHFASATYEWSINNLEYSLNIVYKSCSGLGGVVVGGGYLLRVQNDYRLYRLIIMLKSTICILF